MTVIVREKVNQLIIREGPDRITIRESSSVSSAPPSKRLTEEDFTVSIDPVTGSDTRALIFDQASADQHGAFATIDAAIDSMPDGWASKVRFLFTDGLHLVDQLNFARFNWETEKLAPLFTGGAGECIFESLNGLGIVSGTAAMPVASSSGDVLTLQADPGLGVNAFRDSVLEVTAGPQAGAIEMIRSHTGGTFVTANRFNPVLGSSDVVEIRKGRAELRNVNAFPRWKFSRQSTLSSLEFRAIDFTNAAAIAGLAIEGCTLFVTQGARILEQILTLFDSTFLYGDCVFATDQAFGNPFLIIAVGSTVRSSAGSGQSALFRSSTIVGGIQLQPDGRLASSCLIAGHLAMDGFTGTLVDGSGPFVDAQIDETSDGIPVTDGTAIHAVNVRNGALCRIDNAAAFAAGSFKGTVSDINLDGVTASTDWSDVDAATNKILTGILGTRVFQSV